MLKNRFTGLLLLTYFLSFGILSAAAVAETKPTTSQQTVVLPEIMANLDIETVEPEVKVSTATSPLKSTASNVTNSATAQPSDKILEHTYAKQLPNTNLQSLSDRYGCSNGSLDLTPRQQSQARDEFSTNLNACVDKVISAKPAEPSQVKKEDLVAQKAESRESQFSTTTKLNGEVIFGVSGATGANPNVPGAGNTNIVVNSRVRLNLTTSFSGKDLLITGLQAYNLGGGDNSLQGTLGYADGLGLSASNVRLGYEPQFPGVNPSNLSAVNQNSVNVYKLLYIFPVADKLTMFAGTNAEVSDAFPTISPFANEGQGALSRFGQGLNAATRVSGGTSGSGLATAAGFIWTPSETTDFRALYGSVNASLPSNLGFPGTPLGAGLFNGSSVVSAQLTLKPSPTVDVGLNYANSYHQINILGTGLAAADIGAISPGAAVNPIQLNSIGSNLTWRISPKVAFNVSGSWIFANLTNVNASTTFTSWMTGFHFKDVLKEGNSAGILFGQPLARSSVGGTAVIPIGSTATPYQLEGYLNFKAAENISITPGVFFIFNPEGINNAPTVTVGAVRTTFTF